jgi:Xaa-Pro aminopeptidase
MTAILMYGDTVRHPAIRHEIPLAIIDAVLLAVRNDARYVLTSELEKARIAQVLPDAQILLAEDAGYFELLREGVDHHEAELTILVRALDRWGLDSVVVPRDFPVAPADRIRAAGIEVTVAGDAVDERRRVKSDLELAGIRRAQRAAENGMAVAERLIHGAEQRDGHLHADGQLLSAERVRAAIRAACAQAGAPAPPDIMVTSLYASGGHDPGSGPLPAGLPIQIDLWPCDEASGCWADMTRTFVCGEISGEVAAVRDVVREALEAARAAARPGITGEELYGSAAEVVERAGYPTQRTQKAGESLTEGFYFSLGHGVGLEIHEAPLLGLSSRERLVAGDVIAIEPGVEGLPGLGGVRYEDLLLITEHGSETLTRFPYEL